MIRKVCNTLTTLILIALAAMAILLLVPRFAGYQTLAVLSGSMEPGIPVGSIVYTGKTDVEKLEVGDVMTYRLSGSTMVTHRIVEVDELNQQFITKGDANDVNDGNPVSYEQVVGRVDFHLPLLGYVCIYFRTPLGIAGICVLLFVMIVLNLIPELFEKKENASADSNHENDKNS